MSQNQMQAEIEQKFVCPICTQVLYRTKTLHGYLFEHEFIQQELLEHKSKNNNPDNPKQMNVSYEATFRAPYPVVCANNGKYFYQTKNLVNSL